MEYPFLFIGLTHLMAVISPGPDAALVMRNSTCLSPRQALWGAVGLSCGILTHAILVLAGVTLLLEQYPLAKGMLQLLGGFYLLWLGYQSIIEGRAHHASIKRTSPDNGLTTAVTVSESVTATWSKGYMTNLLNPKAIVYFASILASVVSPSSSLVLKSLLALEIFLISLLWFGGMSQALAISAIQNKLQRARTGVLYFTGTVFVLAGAVIVINAGVSSFDLLLF
ncbi:LysE family translocator [Endozoicomonadaceae bacterium StTr2]